MVSELLSDTLILFAFHKKMIEPILITLLFFVLWSNEVLHHIKLLSTSL